MVLYTLHEISTLAERHDASSNALAIALLGDDDEMWVTAFEKQRAEGARPR